MQLEDPFVIRFHDGRGLLTLVARVGGVALAFYPFTQHAFEKDSGAVPARDKEKAQRRMADFKARMDTRGHRPPRAAGRDAPRKSRGT